MGFLPVPKVVLLCWVCKPLSPAYLLQGGRGQGFIHWAPPLWQKQTASGEYDAGNCNILHLILPSDVLRLTMLSAELSEEESC